MQKLIDTAERILFITDSKGFLVGTLTDGDIRRGIIGGMKLSESVRKIMSLKFVSLSSTADDLRNKARQLMLKHRIEHIPVVDNQGVLVDLILGADFLENEENTPISPQKKKENEVVIMAGGMGTRLDPFTKILPKPLLPLKGIPVIEHILAGFHKFGFSKFKLILNYKKEMIKLFLSDNQYDFDIDFVYEGEFLGTAGGLHLLKDKIDKTFVLTNCDTILKGDPQQIIDWHHQKDNLLTIVGSHKEIPVPYGVLQFNGGKFDQIDEKPKLDLFINTGTYILSPEVFNHIKADEFLNMDSLIRILMQTRTDSVGVFPHWDGWFDMGQWDEYRQSVEKIDNSLSGFQP